MRRCELIERCRILIRQASAIALRLLAAKAYFHLPITSRLRKRAQALACLILICALQSP